ncbi:MAG: QueG-associated DUF1730 domain-containing protein [Candidatus Polarisedimenticolia bacterium]
MDAQTPEDRARLPRAATLAAGREAGLTAVGAAALVPWPRHAAALDAWLAAGAAADLDWMGTTAARRKDPRVHWPWARHALVGALSYLGEPAERAGAPGLLRHVARFARGRDYHDVLKDRLRAWGDAAERLLGRPLRRIALVDMSGVLERELAARAGLGWIGKNACLIGHGGDSWRALGALFVDAEVEEDAPRADDAVGTTAGAATTTAAVAARRPRPAPDLQFCGACRACIDACPTGAISAPWFVDARRCVSYWTIEHRGPIPPERERDLGEWVFGCDVCQEVCPWNRKAAPAAPPELRPDPRLERTSLADLLRLDDAAFRAMFRGTSLFRARRSGVLRNALIVAGNLGDEQALAVARTLIDDPDPLVRETARRVLAR